MFYNTLRKMFPRTPGLDPKFYNELLGYLVRFTNEFQKSPGILANLSDTDLIPTGGLPRNIYQRSLDAIKDRYMVRFEYWLTSEDGRRGYRIISDIWFDALGTLADLYSEAMKRIQEKIAELTAASKAGLKYVLEAATLIITGLLRRY